MNSDLLSQLEAAGIEERQIAHIKRELALADGTLAFLDGVDTWGIDLAQIGIDESQAQTPATAHKLELALGLTSREAQVLLGARYAFWHYDRSDQVYHVIRRQHAEIILASGLYRSGAGGGDKRGIFFLSNREDAEVCAHLIRIEDPAIIAIDKTALASAEVQHDSYNGDHRISSMYADLDWIAPAFLSLSEV